MTSKVSTALEAHHILALTEFITKCSGLEEMREKLQSNKSLLINTISLLKLVHQAAKTDENLSVLNKLRSEKNYPLFFDHILILLLFSDILDQTGASSAVTESPTFGFKELLIELLTNLVWSNEDNQSLVGELGGVGLLLDCSQMDARNPFITQRVVLAVRALTSGHAANQLLLSNLKKLGAADSNLLRELGLERDLEGNIKKIPG